MRFRLPILLCLCLSLTTAIAQNSLQALYSNANYEQCLEQSKDLLKGNPQDSSALFFQGLCLIKAKHYEQAYTSLVAAEAANFPAIPLCQAQQALCLTQLGRQEEALKLLQTLSDAGFSNYTIIEQEEFGLLANVPAFQAVRDLSLIHI